MSASWNLWIDCTAGAASSTVLLQTYMMCNDSRGGDKPRQRAAKLACVVTCGPGEHCGKPHVPYLELMKASGQFLC